MSLKPFDILSKETSIPDELTDILVDANLLPKRDEVVNENERITKARDIFNKAGASLDFVADTVSKVMRNGETDAGRLKAAELTLKVHGVLQELDQKTVPIINITINGSDNKTLLNLVVPTI